LRLLAHVHGDVEVGDYIFVARDSTVPLILRPTDNDETFINSKQSLGISALYKLVGGSYVHGSMNWELRRMMDGVRFNEKTVYLI
jgi:hypothetical protein